MSNVVRVRVDIFVPMAATSTGAVVEDIMSIRPLGAGQEVGRSCHLLSFRGYNILLDCGIHPGRSGMDALPFLDTVELSTVDLLLVSHFHIDHAAGVPYLTEKTDFKGRIFMTHPTKAVMRVLLSDYIRLLPDSNSSSGENSKGLYDEADLQSCCEKIELVDFHQVVEHQGVRFWCYNAGHVLGAAMFMIEIGGVRLLYTGDYSLEEDRHLVPAEIPKVSPHVLVMESTYGTQKHEARDVREALFTSTVESVVQRGGRCLIPVFALGRAQELLLILDEYWQERDDLRRRVPVYYASKLASRALRVYQTYVNMMNLHVQRQMDVANPFRFAHIRNMAGTVDDLDDDGPAVVLASPGMLQSGVSRQLFERWCSDPRNGVIIAGYSVEGTLAKKLMSEPEEITSLDGRALPRRCTVVSVSFSAHTDFKQNSDFVEATSPANVVLVHGERNEMMRFKSQLVQQASKWPQHKRITVSAPELGQDVHMRFQRDRRVAICARPSDFLPQVESRADQADEPDGAPPPKRGRRLKPGVLVSKNLRGSFYSDDELTESSPLSVTTLEQRLHLRISAAAAESLPRVLVKTFVDVSPETKSEEGATRSWRVCDVLNVELSRETNQVELRWVASPFADLIADAVACCALQARAFPRNISGPCCTEPQDGDPVVDLVRSALVDQFGEDGVSPALDEELDDVKPKLDEGDHDEAAAPNEKLRPPLLKLKVAHDDARAVCTLSRIDRLYPNGSSTPDDSAVRYSLDVASEDDTLRQRLLRLVNRVLDASTPVDTASKLSISSNKAEK